MLITDVQPAAAPAPNVQQVHISFCFMFHKDISSYDNTSQFYMTTDVMDVGRHHAVLRFRSSGQIRKQSDNQTGWKVLI